MIFISRSGCLLPSLIILNLFFGRIFFSLNTWLILEAVLFILFIISLRFAARKIFSGHLRTRDAIDVEGQIEED